MTPKFYSEYLPRLGKVIISLTCESDISSARILPPNVLEVELEGKVESFKLAGEVPSSLDIAPQGNVLNIGVAADGKDNGNLSLIDTPSKWCAKRLSSLAELNICCKKCNTGILSNESVRMWNEAPSEMWSEMMDFWHCHKPSDGTNYNANRFTDLRPGERCVITGSYYFSLREGNFQTVKVEEDTALCVNCNSQIGVLQRGGVVKLWKWSLTLKAEDVTESFRPFTHAFNVLQDAISSSASRAFQITDGERRLVAWVFSFGVSFSARVGGSDVASSNAMKLLYLHNESDIQRYLDAQKDSTANSSIDLIDLPQEVFSSMSEILREFKLPKMKMQQAEWSASFLPADL